VPEPMPVTFAAEKRLRQAATVWLVLGCVWGGITVGLVGIFVYAAVN
jgi:hypothetical protein